MHGREGTVSGTNSKHLHILFCMQRQVREAVPRGGPHGPHKGICLVDNSSTSGAARKTICEYVLQGSCRFGRCVEEYAGKGVSNAQSG